MTTSAPETTNTTVGESSAGLEIKKAEEKAKILNQMEFYFGDSNYPRDKFLQQEAQLSPYYWISLDKICTLFNRMKQFKDRALIVEALRESKELIEVNEDGTCIRRKKPINARDYNEFSLYVKGFPTDRTDAEMQQELEQFFNKESGGNLRRLTLRRDLSTKNFKGSVFVEVEEKAQLDEICSRGLKYNDQELIVMKKLDYLEMKKNERAKKKQNDAPKTEGIRKENVLLGFKGISAGETDRFANRKIISDGFSNAGFNVTNVYFCNTEETEEGKGIIEFSEADVSKVLEECQEKLECEKWKLTLYIPTEEEENEYWEFRERFKNRTKNFSQKRKFNFSNRRGKKRSKSSGGGEDDE